MAAAFILASAPVECLDDAIPLTLRYGGEYTAGDAQDQLNARVIGADEAWKTAWKGLMHQAIRMLSRGGAPVTLVAIAGGPACDWERGELRNVFCVEYPSCSAPPSPCWPQRLPLASAAIRLPALRRLLAAAIRIALAAGWLVGCWLAGWLAGCWLLASGSSARAA